MACSGHSHDHEHAETYEFSLQPQIEMRDVRCLNEESTGSCKAILKTYRDRLNAINDNTQETTIYLESQENGDTDLILFIPFSEAVSIKSVSIMGKELGSPRSVKLFVNRDDIDFAAVEDLPPACELDLVHPSHLEEHDGSSIDYQLRPAGPFQNITSVTFYFPGNFGDDESDNDVQTSISYIGLKGNGTAVKRQAVKATYEKVAQIKDHKVPGNELMGRFGV